MRHLSLTNLRVLTLLALLFVAGLLFHGASLVTAEDGEPGLVTSILSTAGVGTPFDGRLPSANVGQVITIIGAGLNPDTIVTFSAINDAGAPLTRDVRVRRVSAEGTSATV